MLPVVVQCTFITTRARTRKQSFWRGAFAVAHSCRRKFFKHVHNLFTHALGSSSPAGLRLEISCESDKKKMNFIFNFGKKIFLTGKRSARVVAKTRNSLLKDFVSQPRRIRNRRDEQKSLLVGCASRVDRIRLCGQFLASASGA